MNAAKIFRWLLTIIATPFLVVLYLNIEKWAEKHGYDLILNKAMESEVHGPIMQLVLHPNTLLIAVAIVFFCLGAWADALIRRRSEDRLAAAPIQPPTFDQAAQKSLLDKLREYARPEANIKILLAAPIHVPFGESLASIFRSAGWDTNFNSTPQETFTHTYWDGIRVHGYNAHLVNAVTKALRDANIPIKRIDVGENRIKRSNPKWAIAEHKIWIRIGHH